MPDLDILRELIRDDTLVIAANDLHGRDVLVLEETRAQPAYAVTIRGLPGEVLAIKEANYQQLFVSVKEIGVNKQPTRRRNRPGLHDTPRSMLKIVAPGKSEVRFRRLIGREAF